jgi:hypothetical protein
MNSLPSSTVPSRIYTGSLIVLILLTVFQQISFALNNPFPTGWDEAVYVNTLASDFYAFKKGGISEYLKHLILQDRIRPPAFRILAFLFVLVAGPGTTALRLGSIMFFYLTIGLVYLTIRRIADHSSACIAILVPLTSPISIQVTRIFGTEYPLFFATAGMLLCIAFILYEKSCKWWQWIALGVFIGIGALSKVSFVAIAPGPILFLLCAELVRKRISVGWVYAGSVALLIAGPWWFYNYTEARDYATYSVNFVRHSLGPLSSTMLYSWFHSAVRSLFGFSMFCFICFFCARILFCAVYRVAPSVLIRTRWIYISLICTAASVPLLVAQLIGQNHSVRLISPIVIPVALLCGIGFQSLHCYSRYFILIGVVMVGIHILPLFQAQQYSTTRYDWSSLRSMCLERGILRPKIAHLGNAAFFNPPQITFPWEQAGEQVQENWLWRYEYGPIDLEALYKRALQSSVVLTAPHLIGSAADRQELDNRYNKTFADMLIKDPSFDGPYEISVGGLGVDGVVVFFRR